MPQPERNRQPELGGALLEVCTALIVVLDREGRIVRFNRACERLTGYSSEDVEGRAPWDVLIPPAEVDGARAVFADLVAGHVAREHEVAWFTRSGEERRIVWNYDVVTDETGRVAHVLGTGQDITEHRRTEEELTKFRLGIERSGEIIFLTDREGRIVYVNPAFEQAYGYSRDEALGRTPRLLKSGLHDADVYEQLWSSLLSRKVISGELINRTKDGRLLNIEGSANPVLDDDGRIIGFLAVQRDITEWKKTERALRASEERLRTVLDKSPDGVGVVSHEGVILYANPAISAMLGYTNEELVGRRVSEIQHPEDRHRAASRIRELFMGGSERPAQYRLVRKDGSAVTAEITSRTIEYEGERALLSTMRDLTERMQLEEQLRQAQKMEAIGQLAGGIAHDFNNLLTVVQVSAELIGHRLDGRHEEIAPNLNELQAAVNRGKQLIEKLLAFSRREELRIEPLDLRALIANFEPTLRRLLPENIEIRIDVPGGIPNVLANAGSVEQIIMNLATNARNAMSKGGELRIALAPARMETSDPFVAAGAVPARFVCLTVSDTGLGMDEAIRARVFEPFFTTRHTTGGTGLGMAVVYGLVKQLRGSVQVSSAVGVGTTIRVYLPVAAAEAAQEEVELRPVSQLRGGSETILLVEDEPALRRAARRSLERLGYRVLLAEDGEQALDFFDGEGEPIDLIVSDIVMPRRSGRGLYMALREGGVDTPFLFSSGYSAGEIGESGSIDPGLPFIAKPWTLDQLARKVREVLDAHEAED
jgi:PAS domain S-box-containing protein